MLKRNDLAKQFEMVVQQEIKNFQNVSYQINQTLNELKCRLDDFEKQNQIQNAFLDSKCKILEIFAHVLQDDTKETHEKLKSYINDNNSIIQDLKDENIVFRMDLLECSRKNQISQKMLESLWSSWSEIQDEISQQSINISNIFDQINLSVNKNLAKMKEEIINLPSEKECLKKEFNEKLTEHKVDVEGIMKEIRVNRKEFMVIEKKLENIYTLIERLKKSEVTP